ncbi:MAG: Trm112 family protein [Actinomycetia bacterium]|nr:Trm112 family protein [Actinomycetes bacterium]
MTLEDALLAILVCPADRGPLLLVEESEEVPEEVLYNPRLRCKYRIDDGIPVLLVDEAVAVDEAEHQRLLAADQS